MKFHLRDVIAIIIEKIIYPTSLEDIQDLLSYMTAEDIMTHEIPRVVRECKPFLIEQFPQLASNSSREINNYGIKEWLSEQVFKYGEYVEVEKLPSNIHTVEYPTIEFLKKSSTKNLILIELDQSF